MADERRYPCCEHCGATRDNKGHGTPCDKPNCIGEMPIVEVS